MRPIDADALLKEAREDGAYGYVDEAQILSAPTINLEDLKLKGKWIGLEYDGYADGNPVYDLWECSNCGNEEKGEDVPEQNSFCRCCGADMRNGAKTEE